MTTIEILKVVVIHPFRALRRANETYSKPEFQTLPIGTVLDVDMASVTQPYGEIVFTAGGDRFDSTLKDIERHTKPLA